MGPAAIRRVYVAALYVVAVLVRSAGCYTIRDMRDVVAYLERFGYLYNVQEPTNQLTNMELDEAVKDFQNSSHVLPTGIVNERTLQLMNSARCGNRDEHIEDGDEVNSATRTRRLKRSPRPIMKWKKSILSYSIEKFPTGSYSKLNPRVVQNEFEMAFKYWEAVTNLKFRKATRKKADITIRFLRGAHGDREAFDGPGRTLAHGFYPQRGILHFDDEERWSIGPRRHHYDLRSVAVHEIGHAIGLVHLHNPKAIMFYKYEGHQSRFQDFKFHSDDVNAVQAIYGPKTSQKKLLKPSGRENILNPSVPNLCKDPKIDAITTMADGITYIFKGDYYFQARNQGRKLKVGKAMRISEAFPAVPSNLDAVLTTNDGDTYFFKGPQFWRWSSMKMTTGHPKPIRRHWKGIPNKPNAAFTWSWNDKVYFFKGANYWRVENSTALQDYPKAVDSGWPGIPRSIDAGYRAPDNRTYIFKGGKYWMFHDPQSEFEAKSYPKRVTRLFACDSNQVTSLRNAVQDAIPIQSHGSQS